MLNTQSPPSRPRRRTIPQRLFVLVGLVLGVSLAPSLQADVKLPGFLTDHMVVQQQKPIRIWGWAEPAEAVEVQIGDDSAKTVADKNGDWLVELPSRDASETPLAIHIRGKNQLTLNDVLVGEVWLCSGQSNMEWRVLSSVNAEAEIAAANYPMIRHMKVPRTASPQPQSDADAPWQVCSPETAGQYTAAGYFMARRLHKELGVPIGLVNSSWGGTRIEPWTPPVGFEGLPELSDISKSITERTPGTEVYQATLSRYLQRSKAWVAKAEQALASKSHLEPAPNYPNSLTPFTDRGQPTTLYNGMIHPLLPMPIRGAIWYQGEANHREGMLYKTKMQALIGGWRQLWNQGDFPFYFVQIAPYQYGNESGTVLAKFWEAQAMAQEIPNTAMVVTNDIATVGDIHPPNKQDVGLRLANLALKYDYGREAIVANSPQADAMNIEGEKLRLSFRNTGGALQTRDGNTPDWFELIGPESGGFQKADAVIDGNDIVLSSPKVAHPVAMRFAWDKTAEPNLQGQSGLPVSAFRMGEVPSFAQTIPELNQYDLVYELDLGKLASNIQYEVDQSSSVGDFNRIAYLVTLESSNGETRSVFVSMDAFTDDVQKIGVPTVTSKAAFHQSVTGMNVRCSDDSVKSGKNLASGRIEFWPNNYSPANGDKVPGASGSAFDFGDQPGPPTEGYGCMQIHHVDAKQTIFAINNWKSGTGADLGIGNHSGEHKDWTFTSNASQYEAKSLKVFVRPAN